MANVVTNVSRVVDSSTFPPTEYPSNVVTTLIVPNRPTKPVCCPRIVQTPHCYCEDFCCPMQRYKSRCNNLPFLFLLLAFI